MDFKLPDNDDCAESRGEYYRKEVHKVSELEIEKQWLRRSQVNKDDFIFFYDKYYDTIYKYIYYRVGNSDMANDIMSDTFLNALNGLSKFRWQGYTVGAWLFQIARNALYKECNARKKRAEVPIELGIHAQIDNKIGRAHV